MGATSSGLQLSSALTKPAAGVGIGAGTLSAGLALAGIHQEKGKSSPFDFESNMLAEFFDRPTLPISQYPATIWVFLNEVYGPTGLTRKEQLLQTWVQVKRIDSLSSTEKIDRLTSQPSADSRSLMTLAARRSPAVPEFLPGEDEDRPATRNRLRWVRRASQRTFARRE